MTHSSIRDLELASVKTKNIYTLPTGHIDPGRPSRRPDPARTTIDLFMHIYPHELEQQPYEVET